MSILAQADLTANTDNLLLTVAAPTTANILISNRTANTVNISIGIVAAGDTLALKSWIEYALPLDHNQPLERGGIPLLTNDKIYVRPSASGVSATVVGLNI